MNDFIEIAKLKKTNTIFEDDYSIINDKKIKDFFINHTEKDSLILQLRIFKIVPFIIKECILYEDKSELTLKCEFVFKTKKEDLRLCLFYHNNIDFTIQYIINDIEKEFNKFFKNIN